MGSVALPQVNRNHQLDLLRIIFATVVLLSHAPELMDGNRSRELFTRFTHTDVTFGIFAVRGFFMLSGYVIMQSWQHEPLVLNFLRKRLLRIVPGYLVAALASTVVLGVIAPAAPGFFLHLGSPYFASLLQLTSPVTPPVLPGGHVGLVNGALYTIGLEFRCYLLVAVFGVLRLLRVRFAWVILTFVMMMMQGSSVVMRHLAWTRAGLIALIGDPHVIASFAFAFCLGGCFYLFREQITFRPLLALLSFSFLVAVCVLAPRKFDIVLTICGSYLMFYLARLRLPSLAWMARVPDVSYGLYLYGWPTEALWIWFFHGSPWLEFAGALLIAFGLGWLSWHFIERPMLRFKHRATAPSSARPFKSRAS